MRTTVTLDDDVAAELERVRASRAASRDDVANEALRRGLREMAPQASEGPRKVAGGPRPFQTEPIVGHVCLIDGLDNVEEVISLLEGDDHK